MLSGIGVHGRQTLPGHLFTHLGFPECPYCIECDIYSRLCYVDGIMVLDNGWRTIFVFLIHFVLMGVKAVTEILFSLRFFNFFIYVGL